VLLHASPFSIYGFDTLKGQYLSEKAARNTVRTLFPGRSARHEDCDTHRGRDKQEQNSHLNDKEEWMVHRTLGVIGMTRWLNIPYFPGTPYCVISVGSS
jgi:hypothetical protein